MSVKVSECDSPLTTCDGRVILFSDARISDGYLGKDTRIKILTSAKDEIVERELVRIRKLLKERREEQRLMQHRNTGDLCRDASRY